MIDEKNAKDELILAFMLRLAGNSAMFYGNETVSDERLRNNSTFVLRRAEDLADLYMCLRQFERIEK
jgi:hypothetical protein